MSGGYVVDEQDVQVRTESDTAEARVTIDKDCGCEQLEQRVIRFRPGRSDERGTGERQEVLYVASGHGTLTADGAAHELEPDTGAFLVPGDDYAIENPGPDDLVVVSVSAPCVASERSQVTVRYTDRPVLPATPNREFRFSSTRISAASTSLSSSA